MSHSHDQETVFAFLRETLQAAGKVILNYTAGEVQVRQKLDKTLVTEADLASEKAIIDRINTAFPEDFLYSEESGRNFREHRAGRRVWVIDPLDGTTNFTNNYPFYCVSIALGEVQENTKITPLAGGIYNLIDRSIYLAYRGGGAYRNGERLTVIKERDFTDSFLASGFFSTDKEHLEQRVRTYFEIASQVSSIRRDGACALDLALVSRGTYDGFWEEGVKAWDVAAGSLLVTEAGGAVQNFHTPDEPFDIEAGHIIAGNPATVTRIAQFLNR